MFTARKPRIGPALIALLAIVLANTVLAQNRPSIQDIQDIQDTQNQRAGEVAGDIAQGFRIMTDRTSGNCVACHALPMDGQAGLQNKLQGTFQNTIQSTFGPSLAAVGQRFTAQELRQWVTDARRIQPNTLMPPFGSTEGLNRPNPPRPLLTAAQISHVVAALQTLR